MRIKPSWKSHLPFNTEVKANAVFGSHTKTSASATGLNLRTRFISCHNQCRDLTLYSTRHPDVRPSTRSTLFKGKWRTSCVLSYGTFKAAYTIVSTIRCCREGLFSPVNADGSTQLPFWPNLTTFRLEYRDKPVRRVRMGVLYARFVRFGIQDTVQKQWWNLFENSISQLEGSAAHEMYGSEVLFSFGKSRVCVRGKGNSNVDRSSCICTGGRN
ncbi:hypothetical protein GB937_010620 [Aspergillus fischeri]|nr:hypothetical protein GB937_010620 [Aspergillus fischeri]